MVAEVQVGGDMFPAIGVGTFGSDRYRPDEVAAAVRTAIRVGYRLIDCASVYGNEPEVGEAIAVALDENGLRRDELTVMSKVWNDAHAPADAIASVQRSLADLRLGYLDAVFVHWPFANHHAPGVDVDARDPHATPYSHRGFMALWRALEDLVDRGLIRHLGVSNVTVPKLRRILADVRIRPSLNEMELHPGFQQPELFEFCRAEGIRPVGYSPLGSPSRPERDRTADDVVDFELPPVLAIAQRRGWHPARVALAWAVSRGQIPIPFSVKEEQLRSNLEAAGEPLTAAELLELATADRGNRLIKGQVFLWEGAGDWRDLWDVDGTIPGWGGYGSPTID